MPTLASPECLHAYTVLCTDFPEVDEPRLSTLESAIEANDPNCPLCVPLLSGAAHGATANRTGQPAVAADSEVPGLVASAAPPACYAAVYASCVLRSCELLTQTDDAISAALGLYVLPQAPAPASDAVEVVVPESSGADEEVWAAEADGDDVEYEPFAPSMSPASSAMAVSALGGKRCTTAEAHERLGHLLGSLSHDALAALDPAEWAKRGLGDAVRTALRQLAEPRWTSVLSPVALRQADGALSCMLRDHLLHNPSACVAELPTTLGALPPQRRPLFLASLIGGGGTGRLAVAPSAAWDAVDEAVRNELVPLLEALGEAAGAMGGWMQGARTGCGPAELATAVLLLGWYLDPPPTRAQLVASRLLSSGAPQLLVRLLLPPPSPPAPISATVFGGARAAHLDARAAGARAVAPAAPAAATTRAAAVASAFAPALSLGWEWLLAACSRPELAPVREFVAAVPAFPAAVRASAHLEARPAQRACWWLLLQLPSTAVATGTGAKTTPATPATTRSSAPASAELVAEGLVAVQALLHAQGTQALAHALELLARLHSAALVLRIWILSEAGRPVLAELEAFQKRVRAATASAVPSVSAEVTTGVPGSPSEAPERGPADGVEKEGELLGRAFAAAKLLMQSFRAPGKGD